MPARNPRVNVVLEKPLYEAVDHLAKEEGVPRSTVVRDLVKEAADPQLFGDPERFRGCKGNRGQMEQRLSKHSTRGEWMACRNGKRSHVAK